MPRCLHITAAALCSVALLCSAHAGPYPGGASTAGTTAIARTDTRIRGWATGILELHRGPLDISDPGLGNAFFGSPTNALGPADAHTNSLPVVSLGDGGWITLTFASIFSDQPGPDFAVFENGFIDTFLELAFVEVSSDGVHYVRFDAVSHTQTTTQIGSFDPLDPTNLHNLAGKYRRGFGTPFDLEELTGAPFLDTAAVRYIRVRDVVGSIDPDYATYDTQPQPNIINDPWPTDFLDNGNGGFDLDAIAILSVPEPTSTLLTFAAAALLITRRKRPR